jgi:transcriptional regulator with XRE-family HTH domain
MALNIALIRLREAKKLTQRTLAERSGLAVSYISRIENGHLQPTLTTLKRIAQGLGVKVGDLFALEEGESSPEPHRCPVSASGQCVGELIRSGKGRKPLRGLHYGPAELKMLRMADYIVLHAPDPIRNAFRVLCESMISSCQEDAGASHLLRRPEDDDSVACTTHRDGCGG